MKHTNPAREIASAPRTVRPRVHFIRLRDSLEDALLAYAAQAKGSPETIIAEAVSAYLGEELGG